MVHILCDVCNESFNRQSSLTRHKKNFHSDLLLVNQCTKCSKTFARRDLLLRHERLHRGEGLSACKVCSREFRNDYVDRHLKKCRLKAIATSTTANPTTSSLIKLGQIQWQEPEVVTLQARSRDSQQIRGSRVQQPLRYISVGPPKDHLVEKAMPEQAMAIGSSESEALKDRSTPGRICTPPPKPKDDIKLSATAWNFLKAVYRTEDGEVTKDILETAFDLNQKDSIGRTPLHWLCRSGTIEDVVELSQRVDDINSLDTDGRAPLCLAIEYGTNAMLKALIAAGANVDINGHSSFKKPVSFPVYETPLEISARMQDHGMMKIVLDTGADPNLHGIFTPLEVAIRNGHVQHVELLLRAGASIDLLEVRDVQRMRQTLPLPNDQYQELKRFGEQGLSHECARTPGQHHTNLEDDADSVSHEDLEQISHAIDEDDSDKLDTCLLRIVNSPVLVKALRKFWEVRREHFFGRNALMQACLAGAVECLRYMLLSYPDLSLTDDQGWTALHYACHAGFYEVVQILLSENDGADYCNGQSPTPLCIAAMYGRKIIVKLLLDAGADINGGSFYRAFPLYYACTNNHSDIALMLLQRGADVNSGFSGATPLEQALKHGSASLTKALLSAGASMDRISEACWDELRRAEESSDPWNLWYEEASEKICLLERAFEAEAQASHPE